MKTFLNIVMIIIFSLMLSISFICLFAILLFLMNKLLVPETNVGLITGPQLMLVVMLSFIIYSMPYVLLINTLVVRIS